MWPRHVLSFAGKVGSRGERGSKSFTTTSLLKMRNEDVYDCRRSFRRLTSMASKFLRGIIAHGMFEPAAAS